MKGKITVLLVASLCTILPLHDKLAIAQISGQTPMLPAAQTSTPSVSQLSDVAPDSWASQALVNLIEQYGVIEGYPDGTFRGDRLLTRSEFAAVLVQVLDRLYVLNEEMTAEELTTIERLQKEFSADIAQLDGRVEDLERRSQLLKAQQFSPTVRFSGQLVTALTAGTYGGSNIIAPQGALVTDNSPDEFFLNRVSLFFDASFDGEDHLQIRLVSGSNGPNDNVAGSLEPNFGSTLDYAVQGRDNNVSIARVFYSFNATDDLQVTLAPATAITDHVDTNSAIPPSFRGFSTQAMAHNFILLPKPFGGGAILDWNPGGGAITARAAYVASSASDNTGQNEGLFGGGEPSEVRLFPAGGSEEEGLFGDPRQGFVELEYAPSDAFALRLQYAGGKVFGSEFNGVGANAELALSEQVRIFGRYGYANYKDTTIGDITPQYWMAGATYADVFKPGDLVGIAVTQPFIESSVGDTTQTIYETFYDFPIAQRLSIAPFSQVVVNPANQSSNGTIVVGGLRTVFSF